MSQLIESIKLLDGHFSNLQAHQKRMDDSLNELYQSENNIDLNYLLHATSFPRKGLYKCRLLYDHLSSDVTFLPYTIKSIRSLKVVSDDDVSYSHKFANRSVLEKLLDKCDQCDDILIVKCGWITDSSYSNIVFKGGSKWYTPHTCLLKGTMRETLLQSGQIQQEQIAAKDIFKFQKFRLINAMLGFEGPECDISNIYR